MQRPSAGQAPVQEAVAGIIREVKEKGDAALYALAEKFDGLQLAALAVTAAEKQEATAAVPIALQQAIREAAANIEKFHASQASPVQYIETAPGVLCWRKAVPIEKAGLYIPGGTAPLFSTVLMLGIPARLAGCKEVVLCSPPVRDGSLHPAILYAAGLCGIEKIYKVGGAQAIAAMAFGTDTIPRVYKIFGPGNQYVTAAKQQLQGHIAIDMPAGPSELLVIADETANAAFVTADLLSQAEHGPDSQVLLLTTSHALAQQVLTAIDQQAATLPRKDIALQALRQSRIVLLGTLEEAIALSNLYAPEHLLLACAEAPALAEKVASAGSVFIGHYSPESAGDYASGTNHTLPTNGYASMYSGVSLDSFTKKISFQQLSRNGLAHIGQTVMEMAAAEGLEAHRRAVAIRLERS